MNCIGCEHFKEKCEIVKIYASGHCEECPVYGTEEPIFSPSGCNFQIMGERIRRNDGFERVDILPMQTAGKKWYCQIMVCFDGKGRVTTTVPEYCLPGMAVWSAWRVAQGKVIPMDHSGLNKLVVKIEERIGFGYSVVEYFPVKQKKTVPMKKIVNERKIFIPKNMDHLLNVQVDVNEQKDLGDQLDLFAV